MKSHRSTLSLLIMANSFQRTFHYLRDSHRLFNQPPPLQPASGAAMPALHPAPSTQPTPPPTPTSPPPTPTTPSATTAGDPSPAALHPTLPVADLPVGPLQFLDFFRKKPKLNILSYFEKTRIGAPARGRRLPPKSSLHVWKKRQYMTDLSVSSKHREEIRTGQVLRRPPETQGYQHYTITTHNLMQMNFCVELLLIICDKYFI